MSNECVCVYMYMYNKNLLEKCLQYIKRCTVRFLHAEQNGNREKLALMF